MSHTLKYQSEVLRRERGKDQKKHVKYSSMPYVIAFFGGGASCVSTVWLSSWQTFAGNHVHVSERTFMSASRDFKANQYDKWPFKKRGGREET